MQNDKNIQGYIGGVEIRPANKNIKKEIEDFIYNYNSIANFVSTYIPIKKDLTKRFGNISISRDNTKK